MGKQSGSGAGKPTEINLESLSDEVLERLLAAAAPDGTIEVPADLRGEIERLVGEKRQFAADSAETHKDQIVNYAKDHERFMHWRNPAAPPQGHVRSHLDAHGRS